jgi:hypothetical protein
LLGKNFLEEKMELNLKPSLDLIETFHTYNKKTYPQLPRNALHRFETVETLVLCQVLAISSEFALLLKEFTLNSIREYEVDRDKIKELCIKLLIELLQYQSLLELDEWFYFSDFSCDYDNQRRLQKLIKVCLEICNPHMEIALEVNRYTFPGRCEYFPVKKRIIREKVVLILQIMFSLGFKDDISIYKGILNYYNQKNP